jgi:hypothetical protein
MKNSIKIVVLGISSLLLLGCPPTSMYSYYYRGINEHTSTSWHSYTITTKENKKLEIRTGGIVDYTKKKEFGLFAQLQDTTGSINLAHATVKSTQLGALTIDPELPYHDSLRFYKNSYYHYLKVNKKKIRDVKNDTIIVTLSSGEQFIFTDKKPKRK